MPVLGAYGRDLAGQQKTLPGIPYSNMPYILDSGGVGNNKQIHRIKLNPNTIVTGAMYLDQRVNDDNPTVNSVHWKTGRYEYIAANARTKCYRCRR